MEPNMDRYLNHIHAIRFQTLALIEEITQLPKPTYRIENQTVSWQEYLKQLQETVTWCNEQLVASEPFEIRTTAGT